LVGGSVGKSADPKICPALLRTARCSGCALGAQCRALLSSAFVCLLVGLSVCLAARRLPVRFFGSIEIENHSVAATVSDGAGSAKDSDRNVFPSMRVPRGDATHNMPRSLQRAAMRRTTDTTGQLSCRSDVSSNTTWHRTSSIMHSRTMRARARGHKHTTVQAVVQMVCCSTVA
jgi:hypothetical protein